MRPPTMESINSKPIQSQTRSRIIGLNFGLMLLRVDSPKPGYSGRGRRGNRVPRKPTLN